MFKCKVDFNAFDKKNDKVANLDAKSVKTLTKGGIKKLAKTEGETTPFHLIVDYFEDENGKVLGSFLSLGINKKLTKHFEQVELKSGKLDKSMSKSPKHAAAGEAFIKTVDGQKVVHIVPADGCKIPKGQWPKILKSLKGSLAGLKAVVVLDGVSVGEEENTTSAEATANKPAETAADATSINLKDLIVNAANLVKSEAKKLAANIKQNSVTTTDQTSADNILNQFKELEQAFASASDEAKAKLQGNYDKIIQYVPQIQKIQAAIQKALSETAEGQPSAEADNLAKELEALLKKAQQDVKAFDGKFAGAKDAMEQAPANTAPSGASLVNELF